MIIIYGGAFNPPTKAHLEIAQKITKLYKPDAFYFLPVGNKYQKNDVIDFKFRYEMLELLCKKIPNAFVSNLENSQCFRGTYFSLKEFSKIDKKLYFVMGSDNLAYLEQWINASRLVEEFNFIIISRGCYDDLTYIKKTFPAYLDHFILLEYNNPISASQFRQTGLKALLCPDIYDYITNNNLYEVKKDVK